MRLARHSHLLPEFHHGLLVYRLFRFLVFGHERRCEGKHEKSHENADRETHKDLLGLDDGFQIEEGDQPSCSLTVFRFANTCRLFTDDLGKQSGLTPSWRLAPARGLPALEVPGKIPHRTIPLRVPR